MSMFSICGIAKGELSYKNMVFNTNNSYDDKKVKEVVYSTDFGDVESLFGFSDLDIVEIDDSDERVLSAKHFLEETEDAEAVIFLREGYLIVTDLMFFSAFTRIGGRDIPYTSLVESNTYEEDEANIIIEEDMRLQ